MILLLGAQSVQNGVLYFNVIVPPLPPPPLSIYGLK